MTPEEEDQVRGMLAQQERELTQPVGAAEMDSALFQQGQQEIENSRQFYLGHDTELGRLVMSWKGQSLNADGKVTTDPKKAIMPEEAADKLQALLEVSMGRPTRLSNFQEEDVKRFTFDIIDTVGGWLVTVGLHKHSIDPQYYPFIYKQVEVLANSSFKWAWNAGGRNFMTTSARTVETVNNSVLGQRFPTAAPVEKKSKFGKWW